MLKFFSRKREILKPESIVWMIETFAWFFNKFGSDFFFSKIILVTPADCHFPDKNSNPKQLAKLVFLRVKKYAGMEKWNCKLIQQQKNPNLNVAPTIGIKNTKQNPMGTFLYKGGNRSRAIITYNPSLLNNPEALITTFAHELAHFISYKKIKTLPSGKAFQEQATDLLASFLGFGIFQSNSAFSFRQFQEVGRNGWSSNGLGYLAQNEYLYALAIFTVLKDIQPSEVEQHLKKTLIKFYRKAVKDFAKNSEAISYLKSIKSEEMLP